MEKLSVMSLKKCNGKLKVLCHGIDIPTTIVLGWIVRGGSRDWSSRSG